MALTTRYAWGIGCVARPNTFDLESVYLHENGHLAGLGHSTDVRTVMYPSYQMARCALAQDDTNGIAASTEHPATGGSAPDRRPPGCHRIRTSTRAAA